MGEQLSKVYEPKVIEQQANEIWSLQPYFHAEALSCLYLKQAGIPDFVLICSLYIVVHFC